MEDEVKKEELLFERLLATYHSLFPTEKMDFSTTGIEEHWSALNNVIIELEKLGHSNYNEFKIQPKNILYCGRNQLRVNLTNLKINMLSVLGMMSKQFYLANPADELRRYGINNSITMSQVANPHASSNQSQEQAQSQKNVITLEQRFKELQRIVDENLTEDQIKQVNEQLKTFKENPSIWKNAQKLIQIGAGFSRDVAVQFIGSVLAILAVGGH